MWPRTEATFGVVIFFGVIAIIKVVILANRLPPNNNVGGNVPVQAGNGAPMPAAPKFMPGANGTTPDQAKNTKTGPVLARLNAAKSKPVDSAPKSEPIVITPKPDPENVAPNPDPVAIAPKPETNPEIALDPKFLNTGVMQAWLGQEKELAATCNRTLNALKETDNPAMAERAAKICSLRPMDPIIHEAALVLARRAVDLGKKSAFLGHFQMALGMAEYRAGNYENADAALIEASSLGKDHYHVSVTSAFYRAMSLFRQGQEAEGRKLATDALAKMRPLPIDEKNPLVGRTNIDDLVLWMAYKEVKDLLKLTR
jgi:hypothetical protein